MLDHDRDGAIRRYPHDVAVPRVDDVERPVGRDGDAPDGKR